MAKTKAQKEQIMASITEKLNRAKSVVFVDYKGLNMARLSSLREKLKEEGAEFTVTKNTLLKRALPATNLKNTTATLFSFEDEIAPLKILVQTLKEAQIGQLKGGFLDKEFLDASVFSRLASLPGKKELQAQTVGLLAAPLQAITGVLQANLKNLVYALNQIKLSRGGE